MGLRLGEEPVKGVGLEQGAQTKFLEAGMSWATSPLWSQVLPSARDDGGLAFQAYGDKEYYWNLLKNLR